MRSLTPLRVFLALLPFALAPVACGTTPLNTARFEEMIMGMGNAPYMYRYGQDLAAQGRLREAHAAFASAEGTAVTTEMREAARIRRMYLEQVIAAREQGKEPPPPPVIKKEAESDQALAAEEQEIKKAETPATPLIPDLVPASPPPNPTERPLLK